MNFLNFALKMLALIVVLMVVSSCASNGFKDFYSPRVTTVYAPTKKVTQYAYSKETLENYLSRGYFVIGTSAFTGPLQNVANAKRHAKKIGADIVLTSSQYLSSEQGTMVMPIYNPGETTSVTTYDRGTVNTNASASAYAYGTGGYAYGTGTSSGSASYSGTSTSYITTPGYTTYTNIPYVIHKYNQQAVYLKESIPKSSSE